jgi:hypothetical protein
MLIALAVSAVFAGSACDLDVDEQVRMANAGIRRVTAGEASAAPVFESISSPAGCGVWELTVGEDGSVKDARLLRGDFTENYERYVRPILLTQTYAQSRTPWTALVVLKLNESPQ